MDGHLSIIFLPTMDPNRTCGINVISPHLLFLIYNCWWIINHMSDNLHCHYNRIKTHFTISFYFLFFLLSTAGSSPFRFFPDTISSSMHPLISATDANHLLSSSRIDAHHFNPIITVTRPDGPPFFKHTRSSFLLAMEIGAGREPPLDDCRHFGWMLFHHETHSSAYPDTFSTFGKVWNFRLISHLLKIPGRHFVFRRCLK